ncbi:3-isopropylmalate dehydrogenase [Legionella massiliensis]|uniref:3-isopropylmalate dehydrogenase n=1 Tax=Legionella massiliensis TaxID=1034943 RepID=A0A078L0K5_9GAMM|nr:3-isopropylmalate dehydrogenase [Legionella massiliensis]CDZ78782.1 3-isopropylmalate dehydrogenase [Legionella massiliensis]CEE14520.1 3-isopropylmalate dehydrogenase [Legionella massiliensis]
MHKTILILPGDGIGPEICAEAVKVFDWLNQHSAHRFELIQGLIGGASIDAYGSPLTEETLNQAKQVDSILLGAVGGPRWDQLESQNKPEKGLLKIRKELGLFANLRPATLFNALSESSPLKKECIEGLDLIIVRELTGDVYFGEPRGLNKEYGFNTMRYSQSEVERIARVAFRLAKQRSNRLCSVDKANVLETSMLWRKTVEQIGAREFPEVELSHMYVDNAAMQLIRDPRQFDVLLTANLFGDILSDEASMLTGSLGMLPSSSFGELHSLYEPIHGSAPDIAGKNLANPLATILSVAMMLQYSFHFEREAQLIHKAVAQVLEKGFRTMDLMRSAGQLVSTVEMGDRVIVELMELI